MNRASSSTGLIVLLFDIAIDACQIRNDIRANSWWKEETIGIHEWRTDLLLDATAPWYKRSLAFTAPNGRRRIRKKKVPDFERWIDATRTAIQYKPDRNQPIIDHTFISPGTKGNKARQRQSQLWRMGSLLSHSASILFDSTQHQRVYVDAEVKTPRFIL